MNNWYNNSHYCENCGEEMHGEKISLTEYDVYFCSEECLRKYMLESDMIEYIKEDENEKENDFHTR